MTEETLLRVSRCSSVVNITKLNLHGNGLIRLKHMAMLPFLTHLTVSFNDLTRLDDLAGSVHVYSGAVLPQTWRQSSCANLSLLENFFLLLEDFSQKYKI